MADNSTPNHEVDATWGKKRLRILTFKSLVTIALAVVAIVVVISSRM